MRLIDRRLRDGELDPITTIETRRPAPVPPGWVRMNRGSSGRPPIWHWAVVMESIGPDGALYVAIKGCQGLPPGRGNGVRHYHGPFPHPKPEDGPAELCADCAALHPESCEPIPAWKWRR